MIVELIQTYPRASIILVAALISLFITIINFFVLDKEKMRGMKTRQKELNRQIKENKDDKDKVMKLQKELMSHAMENMKHSFKPMIITIIPVLVIFWWVKNIFTGTIIAGSWFWYYLVSAIVFSLIFRKLFKLP